jgi:uncharacterized membrane protein YgdD (TMEM256/DUF423 family)
VGGRRGERRRGRGVDPLVDRLSEQRLVLCAGAVLAGLGVALGAFGAHGLKHLLDTERLGWWQTAVQYQVWHGLALVALAAAPLDRLKLPAWLLGAGAAVFSVSLYAMALTDWRWLGAVTPLGGLAMIVGWAVLAWRAAWSGASRTN